MNNLPTSQRLSRLEVLLAGTVFAAALGLMLFSPRRPAAAQDAAEDTLPELPYLQDPARLAPASATLH